MLIEPPPARIWGEHRLFGTFVAPSLFGLLLAATLGLQAYRPLDLRVLALGEVTLIGCVAIALVLLHAAGRRIAVPRPMRPWLSLFCASACVSTAMSPMPSAALVRVGTYLVVMLLAMTVYAGYRGVSRLPLAGWCLAVSVAYVPFLAVAIIDMATWQGDFSHPTVGLFANLRHLGTAGLLSAMASSALPVLRPIDRRTRIVAIALTSFALFAVIASGSRGACLAWLCFVAIIIASARVTGRESRRFTLDAAVGLVVAGCSVLVLDATGLLPTPNLFGRATTGWDDGLDQVSSGRLDVWSSSLHYVGGHPWFGGGPDAYRLSGCCVQSVSHPHDLVLQALMEFGAIGCLFLLAVLWRSTVCFGGLRRLVVAAFVTTDAAVLTAFLLAFLALSMIDGPYYWFFPLLTFAPCCGLWFVAIRSSRPPAVLDQSRPMANADSRS